jgi:hypothetical protein
MRTIVAMLFCAIGLTVTAEELNVLRLGTLVLRIAPTWQFHGGAQRAEGRGPNGEGLIANYRVLRPEAPPEAVEHHVTTVQGFARGEMPRLAEKNGTVIRAVTEQLLPGGRFQFSAVSQGTKMFRDYYFLQYLLGSKRAMVYITVEGYGKATDAAASFDKIVESQEWAE